ncbi:probable cytochrome P450 28d1 [Phlebotomus argentipes]|uniref:probable cytochrome P450 28d1 n=1 Tax=Phlebotomus argentipes TaxID=94469 RepID=UPI002892EE72|nr:probable cytochrome P450 28d1 [Phlebotomus argentipes]
MLLQIAIAAVSVLFVLFLLWRRNFTFWQRKGIDGPKPSLIFGNFPNYLHKNIVYDLHDIYKKYRGCPFVGIYALRKPHLFITDPEFSRKIFTTHFRQFYNNESSEMTDLKTDPIIGLNPFMERDELWKTTRQEITPGFSNNRVKAQFPIMESSCHKMTNYLRCRVKTHGPTIKLEEFSRRYTCENLTNCIFGLESHAFEEKKGSFLQMFKDYLKEFFVIDYYFMWNFIWPSFKHFHKYQMMKPRVKKFFVDMLKHGIAFRSENPSNREDFLTFLMQIREKKGSSIDEMLAHALTFILDGFETSAIVFESVLYELARNMRVQDKLRSILEEEGNLSYDTVNDLPYLDQVFNESLRLHPPILFFLKQCNESIEVPFNDGKESRTFPKGINAMMSSYSLGRDPIFYENPEDFNPERFDDGAVKDYKDKGVFVPFGDGPRICIGMRFAVSQIKTATVAIVRNFKLTLGAEMREPLMLEKTFFGMPAQEIAVNFDPILEK